MNKLERGLIAQILRQLADIFESSETEVLPVPAVTEPESKQAKEPDSRIATVFDYWRTAMKKSQRTKLDAARKRVIASRLKDGYDVDDLMKAIRGCSLTPHNMGQNDRGEVYNDLTLILRDAAHVDRFIRNADHPPAQAKGYKRPQEDFPLHEVGASIYGEGGTDER